MSYYTGLINAWNSATQPPNGITGTGLTGLTTANKLIAINGWTITGAVPTTFTVTGSMLLNCINWAEFAALTAPQQSNLLALCANSGQLLGGSANVGLITDGMFLAYFNHAGPTIAALTMLAEATSQSWWAVPQASNGGGLSSPVSQNDLTAAGGLT